MKTIKDKATKHSDDLKGLHKTDADHDKVNTELKDADKKHDVKINDLHDKDVEQEKHLLLIDKTDSK